MQVSGASTLRSQGHPDLDGSVSIEGRGMCGRLGMWDVVWCLERVFWYPLMINIRYDKQTLLRWDNGLSST